MCRGDSAKAPAEDVSHVVSGGLRAARARVLLAEVYFSRTKLQRRTLVAALAVLACLVGFFSFSPNGFGVLFAILGAFIFLLFFVVYPLRLLLIVSKGGHEFARGLRLSAAYDADGIVVKLPGRPNYSVRYSQIRNIHARGPFLICDITGRSTAMMIPLKLVPEGTADWLDRRVRNAQRGQAG